jgi:hypothetical protein
MQKTFQFLRIDPFYQSNTYLTSKLDTSSVPQSDVQSGLLSEMFNHCFGQVHDTYFVLHLNQVELTLNRNGPRQCSNRLWQPPGHTKYEVPSCLMLRSRWNCRLHWVRQESGRDGKQSNKRVDKLAEERIYFN